jgi:uncharacterized membrane protein
MTGLVEQRYMMAVYPFLFLVAAIPILSLEKIIKNNTKISSKGATIIIFIIFTTLFIYPTLGTFQNSKSNFVWGIELTESKLTSYGEVMLGSIWMKENSNPGDIVISASYPQTAYYSERSTFSFDNKGNPEAREVQNKSEFEEFVRTNRPKFIMVSVFQHHPDWVQEYIIENQDSLAPVQAYHQGEQPVLIVYEVKYN